MLTALRALAIPLLVYSTATLDQVAPALEDATTTTTKPITMNTNMPVIEKLIDSTTTTTSNRQNEKTIYLIRHAESLENVAYKGARSVQASYAARKLPDPKDVVDAIKLAFLMFRPEVMNAALSSLGEEQVTQLHSSLEQDQFWNKLKKQAAANGDDPNGGRVLLAHSPLVRAKQTAYGALLGPQRMAPDEIADDVTDIDIEEIPSLREVNPKEIIGDAIMPWKKEKTVDKRIAEFEQWLQTRPEDTLVVVGHSVYFKRMLNLPETFNNVDVWEARYGGGNNNVDDVMGTAYQESKAMVEDMISGEDSEMSTNLPRQWKSLKRLYRYTPKTQVEEVDEADMNEMMERVQEDMMQRTKYMWD